MDVDDALDDEVVVGTVVDELVSVLVVGRVGVELLVLGIEVVEVTIEDVLGERVDVDAVLAVVVVLLCVMSTF